MFNTATVYEVVEWLAAGLSLIGFYFCVRKWPSCFVWFLIGDLAWFTTAILTSHGSLIAQQVAYIVMNVAGYWIWKREESEELKRVEREKALQEQVIRLQLALRRANRSRRQTKEESFIFLR